MHSLESVQKCVDEVQIFFVGILTLHITIPVSIRGKTGNSLEKLLLSTGAKFQTKDI